MRSLDLKKPTSNRKLIAGVFVVTGMLSGIFWWKGKDEPLLEPLNISYQVNQKKPVPVKDNSSATTKFTSDIASQLGAAQGDYAFYVYRLNMKLGYGLNEDRVFPAASIMKVPIMAAAFKASEQGKIELDETLLEALKAMGKRSDNEAPVSLSSRLGRDYIRQVMKELGMRNSSFDENTTTASDVISVWKTLYSEDYLSSENLELMWEFLTDSIFEERIPAGIPEEVRVVHKVGTDLDVWADAGIVYADEPFVLVILNDGVNLEQSKEFLPKIVRQVWDFEESVN